MGGAERTISELYPSLVKKYDLQILTLKDTKFYDLPSLPLSNSSTNLEMILNLPRTIFILNKLKKENPKAQFVSFLELSNFLNIITENSIISFRTSKHFFKGLKGLLYVALIKLLYPKAKLILVNSEENKKELATWLNININKIQVLPNSYDSNKIKNIQSTNLNKKKKLENIFITISRLDSQKHVDKIITAVKHFPKKSHLLILGDGPEKNNLESLSKKLKLRNKITFLGKQKNVYEFLNKADYFIYASEAEGFPNVLLEAMACKIPIITSDFKTGARELITPGLSFDKKIAYPFYGQNGCLIDLNKYEHQIQIVLKNLDKVQQKQQGLEKYKIENVLKKIDVVLK